MIKEPLKELEKTLKKLGIVLKIMAVLVVLKVIADILLFLNRTP